MKNIKKILLIFTLLFGLIACGKDRDGNYTDINDSNNSSAVLGVTIIDTDNDGLSDEDEIKYGTNPDLNDTDNDGLLDGEEINVYETNATNSDSDNDGLLDGEEINTYETNATNPDTDNDGLQDGKEVKIYGTNATNPDSDGDCLLDGFEIKYYETNATNKDTDGDKVDDGIEIYSYDKIDTSCLMTPETLELGENKKPAIDNLPNDGTDVINALDPNNDSDGDGQVNSFENNCSDGDPLDGTKKCLYLIESEDAEEMGDLGYAYIPGGFDVDGDGINETGFWM